ncbi:ATP-binding protein, partial [candidate division KSB1 bacterium]|nr:ATP-binding protein [candidate division KSB1 bacterium]
WSKTAPSSIFDLNIRLESLLNNSTSNPSKSIFSYSIMHISSSTLELSKVDTNLLKKLSKFSEDSILYTSISSPPGKYCFAVSTNFEKKLNDNSPKLYEYYSDIKNALVSEYGEFQIDIEDTGFGISEDSLPHIFDKFYRITDDEKVQDITGSGLGLSLVKEIIEIHGGIIKVKSKLGHGSRFTIILPKNEQMTEEVYITEQIVA